MTTWVEIVVNLLMALAGGGTAGALITAVARRRVIKVDAADKLSEAAVDWAAELKKEAGDARKEASEARREANDAHTAATAARREADEAGRKFQHISEAMDAVMDRLTAFQEAVLHPEALVDPYVTVQQLQQLARQPMRRTGLNGRM